MEAQRKAFLLWVAMTVLGAALVALPDDDRRILSFTEGHGPAAMDLVGIVALGVGLAAYGIGVAMARARIDMRDVAVALATYTPSILLTGWSVATDSGWWWAAGVAGALAAQAWFAWRIAA